MVHQILIEEGNYPADEAFLLTPGYTGMVVEDATIEVYLDENDQRCVRGRAMATNLSLVELLEDYDDVDLLLDLGGQFKYLLKTPTLKAGKVFSPDVKSIIHFVAHSPLEKLEEDRYKRMRDRISLVDQEGK